MAKDKLKQYAILHAQLVEELKQIEARANEIRNVLKGTEHGNGLTMTQPSRRFSSKTNDKSGLKRGKITTKAAILKVLDSEGQIDIKAIAEKVMDLKGKISKPSIYLSLSKLKKEGKIVNPERGKYAVKK